MKIRNIILLLGDLITMYMALILALIARHGFSSALENIPSHIVPFTLLFLAWLVVLYINDFYSRRRLRVDLAFIRSVFNATLANLGIAVAFFYLIGPTIGITPKTNLFLVTAFSVGLFILWRRVISGMLVSDRGRKSVLFLEPDQLGETLIHQMFADTAMPYRTEGVVRVSGDTMNLPTGLVVHSELHEAERVIGDRGIETVVVGGASFGDLHRQLYRLTLSGAVVVDTATFWEDLNREIPIFVIDTAWLVRNFGDMHKRQFEIVKRTRDFVCALILGTVLSGVLILTAIAVKISSSGSVFYRQIRVGKDGRHFTLVKFRTMREDAEKNGPQWSVKGDQRVTKIGRFLRHTHLDELPQLWNIIKGDMSFVGPRPERPEFVGQLEERVPYYSLRHLVRPGVSGWAQINYSYGASVQDSAKKLAYDLYYIKHRGHLLDVKIGLKTLAMVFRGEGR
ncbi:sugar transferase [Patescibacteria group bacterium]|nr:sugar transferase [Patescibacteria group bacterium]MBU1028722.1 sugar transferase [Patescibacteria group bacterium]MBU1915840.1 sugar transferase [Patescibacteria group bacterium]